MVLYWVVAVSHVADWVVPVIKTPLVCNVVSVLNVPEVTTEESRTGSDGFSVSVVVEIPMVHVFSGCPFSELNCVERMCIVIVVV
jgi:hypothetical protein